MPTYVYKFIDSGETITEIAHPVDGVVKPVKKVFTPVGVSFKGGGFYKTDSGSSSKSSSGSATPSATPAAPAAPAAPSTPSAD
jgi:predicted nucleic acid-binding Zn ribbon protein